MMMLKFVIIIITIIITYKFYGNRIYVLVGVRTGFDAPREHMRTSIVTFENNRNTKPSEGLVRVRCMIRE